MMYLCVWGLDDVLVCMGSRSCTCVYEVSIMYLCVWGLDHVLVRVGSRSCTCVYGVSIMYLCAWGLDHVLVCMGSPLCLFLLFSYLILELFRHCDIFLFLNH